MYCTYTHTRLRLFAVALALIACAARASPEVLHLNCIPSAQVVDATNHWGENVSHENLTPYALNLGARLTKIATASSRRFPQTVAAVFHATSSVNQVILPYSVSRRCPEDT